MMKKVVHSLAQSSVLHQQGVLHGQQMTWWSHTVSSCSLPLLLTPVVQQSSNLYFKSTHQKILNFRTQHN